MSYRGGHGLGGITNFRYRLPCFAQPCRCGYYCDKSASKTWNNVPCYRLSDLKLFWNYEKCNRRNNAKEQRCNIVTWNAEYSRQREKVKSHDHQITRRQQLIFSHCYEGGVHDGECEHLGAEDSRKPLPDFFLFRSSRHRADR
jgi:hypothetical protein